MNKNNIKQVHKTNHSSDNRSVAKLGGANCPLNRVEEQNSLKETTKIIFI
jgi:hypothetical protein